LTPTTRLGSVYASLSKGDFADPANFTESLSKVNGLNFAWYDGGYAKSGIGGFFNMTGDDRSIYSALAGYSYHLWLNQTDQSSLRSAATALATAARQHHLLYPLILANSSKSVPGYYDVELSFAYDILYNWMNVTERNNTRNFIAYLTKGKTLPSCSVGNSVIGHPQTLLYSAWFAMVLSIEGETGYDNSSVINNCLCIKDFLQYSGIRSDGSVISDYGYMYHFDAGLPGLLALSRANICGNLFDPSVTNLAQIIHFTSYSLVGWGNYYSVNLDQWAIYTPKFPFMTYYYIMKYLFPEDELINYVVSQTVVKNSIQWGNLFAAIVATAPNSSLTYENVAKSRNVPLAKVFQTRGQAVIYSDFSAEGMKLDFECRYDHYRDNNLFSSRNHFQLSAKGFNWFGKSHSFINDHHSTIYIDGVPQANGLQDFALGKGTIKYIHSNNNLLP
jgi:hypothetical protein